MTEDVCPRSVVENRSCVGGDAYREDRFLPGRAVGEHNEQEAPRMSDTSAGGFEGHTVRVDWKYDVEVERLLCHDLADLG